MARVFVVSETGKHNITGARQFGEIVVILPPSQAQIAFSSGPTVARMTRVLRDFSDEDYLLFIGDPTAISILSAIAASRNSGRYKCLKWDKQESMYIPIQVDLFGRNEE